MSKFVITLIILLFAGVCVFFVAKDAKPEIQQSYKIVAFGDSLTAGYGVDDVDNYPSVLQERLRMVNPNITVVNMGVSGETTAGGLKRVDSVVAEKPDAVLLGFGANDILRSLSPSDAKANLEEMIEKFQQNNIRVILMGMRTSLNSAAVYRKEFNDIYPQLAEKYDAVLIPFFLEGVVLKEDLNIADRLHPNTAGYVKIVDENIMPVVKGLFR
ncbi:MAG: arylesterase [Patescibacteria group bacterium]